MVPTGYERSVCRHAYSDRCFCACFQRCSNPINELPKLEKWRFARNVKKVFRYVGGEEKARQLVKKLGIKVDVFDIEKVRESVKITKAK